MKELKTMTEYQLLNLAYITLLEKIAREEEKNEITKKELGRDNFACQDRLRVYNEQFSELRDRIIEIENNNAN